MTQEKEEKIIETESAQTPDEISSRRKTSNRKPMIIGLAVVGAVILGVVLLLFYRNQSGGTAVPAPQTVTFDTTEGPENSALIGEQTITLEPEQVERIGLKVEIVGETMSSEAAAVAATGVVQANAYNETPVISLIGGVVRQVNAEHGENVARGQTIAVVFSDELASAQSRYLALQVEVQTARQNYNRTERLVRINPTGNAELDEAQAKLKIAQAELDEHHRHHERTIKLLNIGAVSREEVEQATTRLKSSEAEVERARRQIQRATEVALINPISRSEFEQAAVKLRTSETELASAKQRLSLLGLPEQKINTLRSPSQITSELALTAPISGTITNRSVNQGEVVDANKELMRVTNLSNVWVIAQIYEKDLGKLRMGSGASVMTDAYPEQIFRGQVTYIDPNISQETRTAQGRVELANPGQLLKLGMYVNVSFGALGTGEMTAPIIPSSAVQNFNNRQVVFVATEKLNVFVLKPVRLGTESNGRVVVLEGLNVGDKIVTDGSFLLRAEATKQSLN